MERAEALEEVIAYLNGPAIANSIQCGKTEAYTRINLEMTKIYEQLTRTDDTMQQIIERLFGYPKCEPVENFLLLGTEEEAKEFSVHKVEPIKIAIVVNGGEPRTHYFPQEMTRYQLDCLCKLLGIKRRWFGLESNKSLQGRAKELMSFRGGSK
jgi:hypothetical protein